MVDMREIITRWSVNGGGGGLNVMYFREAAATSNAQRLSLHTFLQALRVKLSAGATAVIDPGGRIVDDATGSLVGFWNDPVNYATTGTQAGAAVANAAQLLMRWNTGVIANGRHIRGRTFVPGFSAGLTLNGEVLPAEVGAINLMVGNLVNGLNGFGVWHRPNGGSPGAHILAQTGTTWNEFAVQRDRRS